MTAARAFAASFCILLAISLTVEGQELPTTLTCTSNAKAWRDYGFTEKQWSGPLPANPSKPFGVATKARKVQGFSLRDKVFSSLNTEKPIVRSITPAQDGVEEQSAEFVGRVVSRTSDAVFFVWTNDLNNKVWLAAIDLAHRKATVTQVFHGLTSVGGEIETLDCR